MAFTTPKKNIWLKEGKFNTPVKEILTPESKSKLENLGIEYNPDNKNFHFNQITGSPHTKKNSSYKSADFDLRIEIINTETKKIRKNRVFKIFGKKDQIISINPKYKEQKKLVYSKTENITKEDLIKSSKVNSYLKGKNKSARQIVKDLKLKNKLRYEIKENGLELLHIIAKIFSGFRIDTQNIKNTFPGIRPANINQRSIIETPTRNFLKKNITKAVKYKIELYQCNPKLKLTKNTERTQFGDLLKVSAEYRLTDNPNVIFKYSVEIPVFKTILQKNNKGKDDGDKYFRKIFNVIFKKLRRHYSKRGLSGRHKNSAPEKKRKGKNLPQSPVLKKKRKLDVNLFGESICDFCKKC